jgi:hypothetical protein
MAPSAEDVLLVSLGSTTGLRRADQELQDSLERAGVRVTVARAIAPAPTRTLMRTDLAWALAARRATLQALARRGRAPAPGIVYSSTTAALLWPRPGAIRFDAPAAGNRPGRHGLWQRPLERRRLTRAPLLLPWSEGSLSEAHGASDLRQRALVLPVPVEPSVGGGQSASTHVQPASTHVQPAPVRDVAAITYAANPSKKGLDRVLAAWRTVHRELPPTPVPELVVAGAAERELRAAGVDARLTPGVRVAGALTHAEYRALVRRARVFVCAPRREDYGIAQLEALADGCLLVTTPAPGPYAALPIAHALDPHLVSHDLAGALRAAFLRADDDYAARAQRALAPFTRVAVDRLVAEQLLARLLGDAV